MHHTLLILSGLLALTSGCVDTGYSPFGEDAFENPDADNDGFPDTVDCEPHDVLSNPDSVEICDGIDNDCDGDIDEEAVNGDTFFVDGDEDGFGDPSQIVELCAQETGYVSYPGDCNDQDPLIHQGALEFCDEIDNDCDGYVDEGHPEDASTWFPDTDADGYGAWFGALTTCSPPTAGYVSNDEDCDDTDGSIHPDGQEICDPWGDDEDCDGRVNDADSDTQGMTTWYYDHDGDGYGTTDLFYDSCSAAPPHFADQGGDCDDNDASRYPGAGC